MSFIARFPIRAAYPSRGVVTSPARRKKLLFSYLPDWILTLFLAAAFFLLDKVNGYRRVFSLDDTSLRHPYAVHERVPNIALYFIAIMSPLCIMPIINFFTVRSWWDLHNSSLGLVLGCSLTGAFTQIVKITVGRPRPDIIDRCQPPPDARDPVFGLTSWTICTQPDPNILRDGFRSFFSGHSSLSFAGLGFLSFYLAGKLHLFDSRGHAGKAWLALSPFMAASLVAISRSMDYRHHWHDILIGSLVGTFLAYFSYRQYYPSLESPVSHQPYSPRIKREEEETNTGGLLPLHLHKREEHNNEDRHRKTGTTNTGVNYSRAQETSGRFAETDQFVDDNSDDGDLYKDRIQMITAGSKTVPKPQPDSMEDLWKEGGEADHYRSRSGMPSGPQTAAGAPGFGGGGVGEFSNTRGPISAPVISSQKGPTQAFSRDAPQIPESAVTFDPNQSARHDGFI